MRLVPGRPRYAILCNFDEFWVYDFETQMDAPVDRLPLSDLPKRWGPLAFLFPSHDRPVFGNDQEKVTRDAADKLAVCFNKLLVRQVPREQAQRFVLQMLVALFAEDIDLLPRYFVARLLDECKAPADSFDLLGGLFEAMNTPSGASGGRFKGVDYFNGGLFAEPARVELYEDELNQLRQAAKEDWSRVRPEIFGTLFEHSLEKEERHAYGGHFTTAADIMKIVHPTITDPWRDLIENAGTLAQLERLRQRMLTYRVLDPACGSGNFLYLAYRELKRLEVQLFERINEKKRTEKGQRQIGHVSASQFYGIDINPFAVEIAKVTMMIARKLAIDELHTIERPLPLDNLDANFIAGDALITPISEGGDVLPTMLFAELETDPFASGHVIPTKWPPADVIIGNPPFLGAKRLKPERGADYVNAVRKTYKAVPGMADYCVYWFRLAHDHLPECTPDDPVVGRAGLVGTQNIRNNKSREGGLDHIVKTGTITEAVDNQPWSGEANVHVSIVNWVKHAPIRDRANQSRARQEATQDSNQSNDRQGVPSSALPYGRGSDHGVPDQSRARQEATPVSNALAYFITYHTHGTWLHGDEHGSVDPLHNMFGEPVLDPNARRETHESDRMRGEPVELDAARRTIVEKTIRDVCEFRGWTLHALNVRSNHVHVVVGAPQRPELVMNDLKSWSTRRMVEAALISKGRKAWARHGSTRYLWKNEDLVGAVRYALEGQGPDLSIAPCALPDGRGSDHSGSDQSRARQEATRDSDQCRAREEATHDEPDLRDMLIPAKRRLWYKIDAPTEREKIRRASSKPAHKDYELAYRDARHINSALSDKTDVSHARDLPCNTDPQCVFNGQYPRHAGFRVDSDEAAEMLGACRRNHEVVHPFLVGRTMLTNGCPDVWVIDFERRTVVEAQAFREPFRQLKSIVLPHIEQLAAKEKRRTGRETGQDQDWLQTWWRHFRSRPDMHDALHGKPRFIACCEVTKRPIFCFVHRAIRPDKTLEVFVFEDDYSFGILQSNAHWQWFVAKCSKLKSDFRYTPESVFNTFPWPQSPTKKQIDAVAEAGRAVRRIRDDALTKIKGGLRAVYRTLELPGRNPLKDAHAALDAAVLDAYGFAVGVVPTISAACANRAAPTNRAAPVRKRSHAQRRGSLPDGRGSDHGGSDQDCSDRGYDLLGQLLDLNLEVAERIDCGRAVTAPGVPPGYDDPAALITDDCIQPPAL